jgi:hypothetical protein
MLQRTAVASLATVCKCWVYRSFESSTRLTWRTAEDQGTNVLFEEGPKGGGETLGKYNYFSFVGI